MAKTTIAVVSDLHCGSTVGLCPPDGVTLDDGGEYRPSKAQLWIWDNWRSYWAAVKRERRGGKLYVVLNGDLVDGDHHGTTQILSGNPEAQELAAYRALDLPRKLNPDAWFVVRGTEAHAGHSASTEEGIARSLRAEKDPDTGTSSWWRLKMDVDGVRLDFRHHGRRGYRPWTEGNAILLLANQIWMEHARRGLKPPDVAIRSHVHKYGDSANLAPIRTIITPAWQLMTSYAHKVVTESIADIGGVTITIANGQVVVKDHLYLPDQMTVWRAA